MSVSGRGRSPIAIVRATMCLSIGPRGMRSRSLQRCLHRGRGRGRAERERGARSDGGRIAGSVWDDADGDGRFDRHEEGLRGVRVYLDDNDNGVLDDGERATNSVARGRYSFDGLSAGTYNVRQEVPFGLRNTAGGEGPSVRPIPRSNRLTERRRASSAVR